MQPTFPVNTQGITQSVPALMVQGVLVQPDVTEVTGLHFNPFYELTAASGDTVPEDEEAGYANGCTFIAPDGTYVNGGTNESCLFRLGSGGGGVSSIVAGNGLLASGSSTVRLDQGIKCFNDTIDFFAKGKIIQITGWNPENACFNIALADNGGTAFGAVFVLADDLESFALGKCYPTAIVGGFNTSEQTVGESVFLDVNGGFTYSLMDGPSIVHQRIGHVATIDFSDGQIAFAPGLIPIDRIGSNQYQDASILAQHAGFDVDFTGAEMETHNHTFTGDALGEHSHEVDIRNEQLSIINARLYVGGDFSGATPVVGATLSQDTSGATGTIDTIDVIGGNTGLNLTSLMGTFDTSHVVTGTNLDTSTFTFTPDFPVQAVWIPAQPIGGIFSAISNNDDVFTETLNIPVVDKRYRILVGTSGNPNVIPDGDPITETNFQFNGSQHGIVSGYQQLVQTGGGGGPNMWYAVSALTPADRYELKITAKSPNGANVNIGFSNAINFSGALKLYNFNNDVYDVISGPPAPGDLLNQSLTSSFIEYTIPMPFVDSTGILTPLFALNNSNDEVDIQKITLYKNGVPQTSINQLETDIDDGISGLNLRYLTIATSATAAGTPSGTISAETAGTPAGTNSLV